MTIQSNTKNKNLQQAREGKNDEFYTQLSDIERELTDYKKHFRNKVVLCNCDDPRVSKFFHYFSHRFEMLGLRKLITTCYKNQDRDIFSRHDCERAISLEYHGDKNKNKVPDPDEVGTKELQGDGDFRSDECVALLKQADVVVTNPPFSLFREYVAQLVEHKKKFLIIGNMNAITYKEIFKHIKGNKMWMGISPRGMDFVKPNGEIKNVNACWFTNLDYEERHKDLVLYKEYNPDNYPKYDNYDAININKIKDIPLDYKGAMGVPITFLDKYNPDQFEIIGMDRPIMKKLTGKTTRFYINGKEIYARILIKHRN